MTGHFPRLAPDQLRFAYCPICGHPLTDDHDEVNGVVRPTCGGCGWIHYPPNYSGALAVVEHPDGLVLIHPPGASADAPCGLPGGIVEFGESPEECAVREVEEETGLRVRLLEEVCRFFDRAGPGGRPLPFGPMMTFGYRAEVIGGSLREGDEGPAVIYPADRAPLITPDRRASARVFGAYLSGRV